MSQTHNNAVTSQDRRAYHYLESHFSLFSLFLTLCLDMIKWHYRFGLVHLLNKTWIEEVEDFLSSALDLKYDERTIVSLALWLSLKIIRLCNIFNIVMLSTLKEQGQIPYHCSCIMINNLITKNEVACICACFVKVLLHYDCTHSGPGRWSPRHMQHTLQRTADCRPVLLHAACTTGAPGRRGHRQEYRI